jgi:hypothetical protein
MKHAPTTRPKSPGSTRPTSPYAPTSPSKPPFIPSPSTPQPQHVKPTMTGPSPSHVQKKASKNVSYTTDELIRSNEYIHDYYENSTSGTPAHDDLNFALQYQHFIDHHPNAIANGLPPRKLLKKQWKPTLKKVGYSDMQIQHLKVSGFPVPQQLPNLTVKPPVLTPAPAPPTPSFVPGGAPAPIVLTPTPGPPPAVNPGGQPSAPPAVNPNTGAVIHPTTSTSTSTSSSSSSSSNPPPPAPPPPLPKPVKQQAAPPAPPKPLPPLGNQSTTPLNQQNQNTLTSIAQSLTTTGGGGVGGTGGAGGTVSGGGGGAPGAPLNPLVASGASQAAPGVVGGGGVLAPQVPIAPAILKTPLAPFGNVDDKGGDIGSIATLNSQIASLASKPNDVYRPGININSEGLIPAIDPYAMTRRDREHDSVSEFQHIPKTDMGTPKEKMNRGVGETKGNWRYNGPYDHPPGVSNPEYLKLENMVLKNENAARQKGLRQISMWSQTHTKSGTPASRANHFSYNHQKGSWKRMNNNDYRAWMEKRNRRFKEGSEKLAKIKPMTLSEIQSAKRRKMNQDASHGGFISHY